jgi:Xaa-Pro dipeptidase
MERPVVALFRPLKKPLIVLPVLEKAKLDQLPFAYQAFPYTEDRSTWIQAFQQAAQVGQLAQKSIGVISRRLRVLELRLLQEAAPGAEFLPAEEPLSRLRMIKGKQEIQALRSAVDCAQEALQRTLEQFQVGMTERELAAELTTQLLKHGSDPRFPFHPIVSAGPNTANPHASPADRKIQTGELLLIDWGANIGGYFSDITRTFAVGSVPSKLEEIARITAQANQAARDAARAGTPARLVDKAARDLIENAGYGEYFIHRTGHGLGREAHEEPYIAADQDQPLEVGMTFTIEPGIYLPDQGGVRVEDDVLITEEGCESLTTLPRPLERIA